MSNRRRFAPAIALIAALTALAAPSPAAAAGCGNGEANPHGGNLNSVEHTVLCLLNRERTKRGLSKLRSNKRLAKAATKHSKDMVRRNFFSHNSPGGASPTSRVKGAGYLRGSSGFSVGENIAYGTGHYATPQSIVRSWMNSAGHKANILHRSFKEIGIGIALGAPGQGRRGATYTTNFGARV
jgi:uncharacterized protein YkwD